MKVMSRPNKNTPYKEINAELLNLFIERENRYNEDHFQSFFVIDKVENDTVYCTDITIER